MSAFGGLAGLFAGGGGSAGIGTLGGITAGLGGALSFGGSLLGGSSANRAARQAEDFNDLRTGTMANLLGGYGLGDSYFGLQRISEDMRLAQQRNDWDELDRLRGEFNNAMPGGGSLLEQQQALAGRIDGAQGGLAERSALADAQLSNRVSTRNAQILDTYNQRGQGLLNAQMGINNDVNRTLAANVRDADMFGRGREEIIRRDLQRAGDAASGQLQARLSASGFGGSTAAAQMESRSSLDTAEGIQDALTGLRDAQLSQRIGARNAQAQGLATTGAAQTAIMNQLMQGQTGLQRDALSEQIALQQYGIDRQVGLQERGLQRSIAAQQAPIDLQAGLLQSNVMNPFLGGGAIVSPGASGLGSGLSDIGNALGGLGGNLLGRYFETQFGGG